MKRPLSISMDVHCLFSRSVMILEVAQGVEVVDSGKSQVMIAQRCRNLVRELSGTMYVKM